MELEIFHLLVLVCLGGQRARTRRRGAAAAAINQVLLFWKWCNKLEMIHNDFVLNSALGTARYGGHLLNLHQIH